MMRFLGHAALLFGAVAVSATGYLLVEELRPGPHEVDALLGSGYHLSSLKLFDRVRYFVSEKYVDPERIDPEAMFEAALDEVERQVDPVLFRRPRGGEQLYVTVGTHEEVIQLGPLRSLLDLRRELGKVAAVLEHWLDPQEVKLPEVEYALINGMLSTLDPHSVLMPPEVSREMDVENQGEFGGLGITITIRDGKLTVEYPLEDTPAWRAGIRANDRIVRIEGESTINMTLQEAVDKLRGPPGEPVTITIMRDSFQEPRDFRIVRDVIRINPVVGELLEGGIGYVRIKAFHANATRDLDAVLSSFRRELGGPPRGLVLDLRGNPGGFLNQAVEVADRFLDSGVVVATVSGDGQREEERASPAHTEPDYPLAVLVDASSASASEIVSGALKYHDRAVVLGERTFGKGSVQHLYDNADESKLKLTVAHYLTPGDRDIQSVGITPDFGLVPEIVQWREEDGKKERLISLLWRERVSRETDLERHLEGGEELREKPAYRLAFLYHMDEDERRSDHPDPKKDWEVEFARQLLLGAGSPDRPSLVAGAAELVERRRAEEESRIVAAFQELGIDWRDGPQPAEPRLQLELDLGPDGKLVAGEEEPVRLRLTNLGDEPLYRVFASTESDNEWLDGDEFYFGYVPPGATVEDQRDVKLAPGYPSELDAARFQLRDPAGHTLARVERRVQTLGRELPHFRWTLALHDGDTAGSRGDADGVPEPGELVELSIHLENDGAPARAAFAKLRNESGHALDLVRGTLDFGELGAGGSAEGSFAFTVAEDASGPLELELSVGDDELFDYAAILRAGFYDELAQKQELRLPTDAPPQGLDHAFSPPSLELSRRPGLEADGPHAVLSGLVRDDREVRDVIVYRLVGPPENRRADKVDYQAGSAGARELPFTVELELEPGLNTFVVVAHDDEGFTLARSVQSWLGVE